MPEVARYGSFQLQISLPPCAAGMPRDKIVAGSLAGCMEPFMFFGLHGALVSGKIAAAAVTDKEKAYAEFLKCNRFCEYRYACSAVNRLNANGYTECAKA
jgi:hypothetical protein